MGNTIIPAGDGSDDGAARWLKAAGDVLSWEHCTKPGFLTSEKKSLR
ncbi:hypothetical protein WKK05_36755 (plasmid) [Nostoc sp. UHCC 0302]